MDMSKRKDFNQYYVENTLLITLFVLHVYWWILIWRMLIRQLQNRGKVGEDVRSGSLTPHYITIHLLEARFSMYVARQTNVMIVSHKARHKIIMSGNWTLYEVAQPKTNTKAMTLWRLSHKWKIPGCPRFAFWNEAPPEIQVVIGSRRCWLELYYMVQ